MKKRAIAVVALVAGMVVPQSAVAADDGLSSRTSGVTYWLDRTYPGPYVGGMVVVRQGKRYFAAARFFEGRACLAGKRSGAKVRMRGQFEYASVQNVASTWRIVAGVPRVRFNTAGKVDWGRVSRQDFINGSTTGTRLRDLSAANSVQHWRAECGWSGVASVTVAAAQPRVPRAAVGLYSQHAGGLRLRRSGVVKVSYQAYLKRDGGTPSFPQLTLRVTSVRSSVLRGKVTSSTDPRISVGTRFRLVHTTPGVRLTVGSVLGTAYCDYIHRIHGVCGA